MSFHHLRVSFVCIALCFSWTQNSQASESLSVQKANDFWQKHAETTEIKKDQIHKMLTSTLWQSIDPTWTQASKFHLKSYKIGERTIVRVQPEVQGLPVFGATRIITFHKGQLTQIGSLPSLMPLQSFRIDDNEALLNAHKFSPKSLLIDPSVERTSGLTMKGWHQTAAGLLPVFKVRIPTLQLTDLYELYIDGNTGELFRAERVAKFADGGVIEDHDSDAGIEVIDETGSNAQVFVHAPAPSGIDTADLQEVTLTDLQSTSDNASLDGWHFVTRNCCKHYTCSTDLVDGLCPLENQVCSDETEGEGVILSELTFAIPADSLPSAISFLGFSGDTLHAKSVFCAELPRAKKHTVDGKTGWYYDPVDKTRASNEADGLLSEEDAFAEVQVYHATQSFFEHVRDIMENESFCLDALSMDCDEDGNSVLDENGLPLLPFHISTNLLLPEFDLQALSAQLVSGLGQAADTPVIINDYQRLGNAAFVPAMSASPIEVPDELSSLTDFFSRPYDSNIYLQGDRDFSYDGDVIYHEFTHALVHTLAYGLRQSGYDKYGSHVEPGAMNEGWSDYFSISFTNDPETGEYAAKGITGGETGLRTADNEKRCPDDLIGEVHEDATPLSGALWEIRTSIFETYGQDGVDDFDQLLFTAIAQAEMNETLSAHVAKVITLLETTFTTEVATTATEMFNDHNVRDCERVYPLVETEENGQVKTNSKAMMMQPSGPDLGLAFAPSVMQFKIEAPANTADITILWEQDAGGGFAGFGGGEATPLKVLVAETEDAIEWRYEGSSNNTPTPYFSDGTNVPFDINATDLIAAVGSAGQNGRAAVNYAFDTTSCEPHTYHISILSNDSGATMYNINALVNIDATACEDEIIEDDNDLVDNDSDSDGDEDATAPDAQGCGCSTATGTAPYSSGLISLFFIVGLTTFNRLRRRRTLP